MSWQIVEQICCKASFILLTSGSVTCPLNSKRTFSLMTKAETYQSTISIHNELIRLSGLYQNQLNLVFFFSEQELVGYVKLRKLRNL